jgi:acyl dehydratase
MSVSIQVGQVEHVKKVYRQQDFDRFATLSGDDNPIHVDPEFSARTKFGRTVAHGMLLYSTVCAALGNRLPGPGTLQLEQELMFPNPTYSGEEITIQLEVTQVQPGEGLADLNTVVVKPDGSETLRGRTLVRLPDPTDFRGFGKPRKSQHVSENASFKGLKIGQRAETRRTFTVQDLAEYADLTGDANPLFTDASYARRRGLAGPLIPGGLLGGLFSYLLGTQLPGPGTNYLKQRLEFLLAPYPDQELTALVEVTRLRPEKHLVNLRTVCTNPSGSVVCEGEALVLTKDVKRDGHVSLSRAALDR